DTCDPLLGVQHAPAPAGTSCSDGMICNGPEACDNAGNCLPGTPPNPNDNNPCTMDSCHPVAGVIHINLLAGTPCGGDACTGLALCDGNGVCAAGTPPQIDDSNPCTVDTCHPVLGVKHAPAPAGTPCPNSDPCDGAETCSAGQCVAGPPPVLSDSNPCTLD